MAIPIIIPRLGWSAEEGVFGGWLKPDGATVRAGDYLFNLEADKAAQEIECLEAGILQIAPDCPKAGDTIAVGTVIGYLVQPGEASPCATPAPGVIPVSGPRNLPEERGTSPTSSPRARRVARELGIDWTKLSGGGRTGRIREREVRAASASKGATASVSAIRKTIAERMLTSHRSTAPVTLTTTSDATNLVNLRRQFQAAAETGSDLVPSYTDFLVKLTAIALQGHPLLNARWEDEQILPGDGIHVGIAVDTDVGLLVPVLRDVPALTLKQVAARSQNLIERARQQQLAADELRGGTFTLTNLGAFGIEAFTPLINCPQCAVLGVGRIQRRPAVVGRRMVPREQGPPASLTFDHRIVDGAPAARFLQMLSRLIENPGPSLMA